MIITNKYFQFQLIRDRSFLMQVIITNEILRAIKENHIEDIPPQQDDLTHQSL